MEYALVAFQFLPPLFTMAQLRAVYEVIRGRRIDPTNFRRRVEATGSIVPTGNSVPGGRHRPPALYRCAGDPASLVQTLRPRRVLQARPRAEHSLNHRLTSAGATWCDIGRLKVKVSVTLTAGRLGQ